MKHGFYWLSLVGAFLLGALTFGGTRGNAVADPAIVQDAEKPAYMIVSGKRLKPTEAMTPYRQAVGPLARGVGIQMLASKESKAAVEVLEGQWPYDGFLVVEKYSSMPALLKFWNSPEYQTAKKLRDGVVKMDFIVAIEGLR